MLLFLPACEILMPVLSFMFELLFNYNCDSSNSANSSSSSNNTRNRPTTAGGDIESGILQTDDNNSKSSSSNNNNNNNMEALPLTYNTSEDNIPSKTITRTLSNDRHCVQQKSHSDKDVT